MDASDPHWQHRIDVTDTILERIGAEQPRIYVFNQIDKISVKDLKILKKETKQYSPIFVSARTSEGLEALKKRLQKKEY